MERRGGSISYSFYVRSYQEKNVFIFLYCQNIYDTLFAGGFFLRVITQCVQLLRFVGTLLAPLCSAHRAGNRGLTLFYLAAFPPSPGVLAHHLSSCFQRNSMRCNLLWELWVLAAFTCPSSAGVIAAPWLCFHPPSV